MTLAITRGNLEHLLRDLRDRQVGVVTARTGDEHVGLLDAGFAQRVDLHRVTDREAAARVLPGRHLPGVEPLVRERVLVEHRDLVSSRQH